MTSIRVIPVSAVLSRVPYECLYLQKWVTPPLFGARAPLKRTISRFQGRPKEVSRLMAIRVGSVKTAKDLNLEWTSLANFEVSP